MNISNPTWQSLFISFIVLSLVLVFLFRLLRYVIPLFARKNKTTERIHRILPVIEISVWFTFLSWFVFRFAEIKQAYAIIILTILIFLIFWISKFLLKELIAGIIFRSTGHYSQGDHINFQGQTGIIRRFRVNFIEAETPEGEILFIPYSQLAEEATIKKEGKEQTSAYTFLLETFRELSVDEMIQNVRSFILSLPWSSVKKMPGVILVEESEDQYLFEITVYPVQKNMAKKIEYELIKKYRDNTSAVK